MKCGDTHHNRGLNYIAAEMPLISAEMPKNTSTAFRPVTPVFPLQIHFQLGF